MLELGPATRRARFTRSGCHQAQAAWRSLERMALVDDHGVLHAELSPWQRSSICICCLPNLGTMLSLYSTPATGDGIRYGTAQNRGTLRGVSGFRIRKDWIGAAYATLLFRPGR